MIVKEINRIFELEGNLATWATIFNLQLGKMDTREEERLPRVTQLVM